MKKIFLFTVMAIFSLSAFSQSLPKGSLIGLHSFTVKLNGKTTMQEFIDFQNKKWAPALSKTYNCEVHILKHIRGENENKVGLIIIFKNEADRNKYYKQDGSLNDFGKAANDKMKEINKESNKLGTTSGGYTDWLVQ
jgi:hypothetical protein